MAAVQAAFESDTRVRSWILSNRSAAWPTPTAATLRSMVEYTLAVKNVMFESNTLLENNGINLAEGPWPGKAYRDAAKRDSLRSRPLSLSYILSQGPLVSTGIYPQQQFPPSVAVEGGRGTTPERVAPPNALPAPAELPAPARRRTLSIQGDPQDRRFRDSRFYQLPRTRTPPPAPLPRCRWYMRFRPRLLAQ